MSFLNLRGGWIQSGLCVLAYVGWIFQAGAELRLRPPETRADGRIHIQLEGLGLHESARIERLSQLGGAETPTVIAKGDPGQSLFLLPSDGAIESYYRAVVEDALPGSTPWRLLVPEGLQRAVVGHPFRLAPQASFAVPHAPVLPKVSVQVSPMDAGFPGDRLGWSTEGPVLLRSDGTLVHLNRPIGRLREQGTRLAMDFLGTLPASDVEAAARQVELTPAPGSPWQAYRQWRWELQGEGFRLGSGGQQMLQVIQDCGQATDLVVVLDRSTALTAVEWQLTRDAVAELMRSFPLSRGYQRMGLVSFCAVGYAHTALTSDRAELLTALSRIQRGSRIDKLGCNEIFIGSGLDRGLGLLTNAASRRVMVLLSVGREVSLTGAVGAQAAETELIAKRARQAGVQIFAYPLTTNANVEHLGRLAFDASALHPTPHLADLRRHLQDLATASCVAESPFPLVDPGSDRTIWLPNSTSLEGHCPGCSMDAEVAWTADPGPGAVRIEGRGAAAIARFQSPGRYQLHFHVTDRGFHLDGAVQVTALQSNQPPVVRAGPDLTVGQHALLAGEMEDDRIGPDSFVSSAPVPVLWTQISGPVAARFDHPDRPRTFVDLPSAGRYVFELEARDACGLHTQDRMEVVSEGVTSSQMFRGVGYASAGVGGLRDFGSGTLRLVGVRGPVRKAFLIWHGPVDSLHSDANALLTFNGKWIQGRSLGMSHDDQWVYDKFHPYASGQAYQADVTAWVAGDGDYQMDHASRSPQHNINGASLIVLYEEPDPQRRKDVALWMGNDSNGDWSPAVNGAVSAIQVQGDGRVLLAGAFTEAGGFPRLHLARLLPDGQLDQEFNPDTEVTDILTCLALEHEGGVVAGGQIREGGRFKGLARWNSDGSRDRAFATALPEEVHIRCLAQVDGGFCAGGAQGLWWLERGGRATRVIEGDIRSILVMEDGTIWCGGGVRVSGETVSLARVNLKTGRVEPAPSLPDGAVLTMVSTTDGRFFAGGAFSKVDAQQRHGIARFSAQGQLDDAWVPSSLNEGGLQSVTALHLQKDDDSGEATGVQLVVAGQLRIEGPLGIRELALLRLTDGSLEGDGFQTVPRAGAWEMNAIAASGGEGPLWVGGFFSLFGIQNRVQIDANGHILDQNRGDEGWSQRLLTFPGAESAEMELHVSDGQSALGSPYLDPVILLNGQPWLAGTEQTICDVEQEQLFSGTSVPDAHYECSQNRGLWDIVRHPLPAEAMLGRRLVLTSAFEGTRSAADLVTLVAAAILIPTQQPAEAPHARGDLVLRDDQFTLARMAGPTRLAVLQNDHLPPGSRIIGLSTEAPPGVSVDSEGSSLLFGTDPDSWRLDLIGFDYVVRQPGGVSGTGRVTVRCTGDLPPMLSSASGSLSDLLDVGPSPTRGPHHAAVLYRFRSEEPETLSLSVEAPEFPGHLYLKDPEGRIVASDWHSSDDFGLHTPRRSWLQISSPLFMKGDYQVEIAGNAPEDHGWFNLRWHRESHVPSSLEVRIDGLPIRDGMELGSLDRRGRKLAVSLINRSQTHSLPTRLSARSFSRAFEVSVPVGDTVLLASAGAAEATIEIRATEQNDEVIADFALGVDVQGEQTYNYLLRFHTEAEHHRLFLQAKVAGAGKIEMTASTLEGEHLSGLVFLAESAAGQVQFPVEQASYVWKDVPPGEHILWARSDQGRSQRVRLSAAMPPHLLGTSPDSYVLTLNSGPQALPVLTNDTQGLRLIEVSASSLGEVHLDSGGQLVYQPHTDVLGTEQIRYVAMDDQQIRHEETVDIEIARPRVWIVTPQDAQVVPLENTLGIQVQVDRAFGPAALTRLWDGETRLVEWEIPPFTLNWKPGSTGFHRLLAETLGADGVWHKSSPVTVGVATADDRPPQAEIQFPTEGSFVREGLLEVLGVALDPDGPASYELSLSSPAGTEIQRVSKALGKHADSLGSFDLTQLPNGTYDLLLSVRGGVRESQHQIRFALQSELKIGRLEFSQTDLQLPTDGVPLALIRRYDSWNARGGDFGPGWSLDLYDLDLQLDEERSTRIDPDTEEPFLVREGGGRTVTLTVPGGPRVVFAYSLKPGPSDGGVPCFCYRAEWTPAPGIPATLTALGNRELRFLPFQKSLPPFWLDAGPGTPYENYDFRGWVLTNSEGVAFEVERPLEGRHSLESEGPLLRYVDTYGRPRLRTVRARSGERIELQDDDRIEHLNALGERTRSFVMRRGSHGFISEVFGPASIAADGSTIPGSHPLLKYEYEYGGEGPHLIAVHRLQDRTTGLYTKESYGYTNRNHPHQLSFIRDARGVMLAQNQFDSKGRLIGVSDPVMEVTRLVHDVENRREEITDPLQRKTLHEYDTRGNVVRSISSSGAQTIRQFDEWNRPVAETNASGTASETWVQRGFDDAGRITALTNASGVQRFGYDHAGALLWQIGQAGQATTNHYDVAGRLTNSVTSAGLLRQESRRSYDGRGRLHRLSETGGLVKELQYDPFGFPAEELSLGQTGEVLRRVRRSYDLFGNLLREETVRSVLAGERETNSVSFAYDAQNRRVAETNALGRVRWTRYDASGLVKMELDEMGRATQFHRDRRGLVVQMLAPADAETPATTTRTVYDALGRRVFEIQPTFLPAGTDPLDSVIVSAGTFTEYDAEGRVKRSGRCAGLGIRIRLDVDGLPTSSLVGEPSVLSATETHYDVAGRMAWTRDAAGVLAEFHYDAVGRQIRSVQALGTTVESSQHSLYSAEGTLHATVDAAGRRTDYAYDAMQRRVRTLLPEVDGKRDFVITVYDPLGRSVAETNELGIATGYGYDLMSRLVSVTNALGTPDQIVTSYSYDENGRMLSQTDALGRVTRYAYDAAGRRVSRTLPGGEVERSVYDAAGNLRWRTNFNGRVIEQRFDARNRLLKKVELTPSGETLLAAFSYSATGQRLTQDDPSGATRYAYDDFDRLQMKSKPGWGTLTYDYTPIGRLSTIWIDAAGESWELRYSQDAQGRLTEASMPGYALGAAYSYDIAGNLAGLQYANGVSNRYAYDGRGRLTSLVWEREAAPLARFDYQLNAAGQRIGLQEMLEVDGVPSRDYAWTYDSLQRLTRETITGLVDARYRYDAVGNRLERTSTTPALSNQRLRYDRNDRLDPDEDPLNGNPAYDEDGNPTRGVEGGREFEDVYDAENRLIERRFGKPTAGVEPSGKAASPSRLAIVYDADGAPVQRNLSLESGDGGLVVEQTRFLVEDQNPTGYPQFLAILQGGENRGWEVHQRLLWAKGPVGFATDVGQERQATYWVTDGHGSVRNLDGALNGMGSGTLFDAWGVRLERSRPAGEFSFGIPSLGYAGEWWDEALGVSFLRSRNYAPARGRFLTRDTYEGRLDRPTSRDAYGYAEGDPVNHLDPTGHSIIDTLGTASTLAYLRTSQLVAAHPFLAAAAVVGVSVAVPSLEALPPGTPGPLDEMGQLGRAVRVGGSQTFKALVRFFPFGRRPIRASTFILGTGDDLAKAASWVVAKPGYVDVIVHGSEEAFHVLHNGRWVEVSHRSLAQFLKNNGYKGGPVRLVSCSTGGSPTGVAKDLANKLGAEVIAPSDTLWVHPAGRMTIGAADDVDTGSWQRFLPGL